MDASQSLPELVATAQAGATLHEAQIAEIRSQMGDGRGTDDQLKDLHGATTAIELLAVDIFAVFESRMQHHFKRGPFARKLKALLIGAGQPDLANRIYQYYLAINVLKHGTGASHRELIKLQTSLFDVKSGDDSNQPIGLIDVTTLNFSEGLMTAILEAYHFLER